MLPALFKDLAVIAVVSFLFYGSFYPLILGIIPLFRLLRKDYDAYLIRRRNELALEFREAVRSMSDSMHSGSSLENAMKEAVITLGRIYGEDADIVRDFRIMDNELSMRMPVETVWNRYGQKCGVPEISDFAAVVNIGKRTGGDMLAIMEHTEGIIGQKLMVRQEIQTIMASRMLEWRIMTLIPVGIILYLKLSFPEFMDSMYGNRAGALIMSCALVIMIAAYAAGERIVRIEV